MDVERITYLVANRDNSRYLADCLRSLEAQTSLAWLAIVCDDRSTDDSVEVIRRFVGERVELIINERHLGYTATLKRLIASARTDIVAILDSDDALTVDATERLLQAYRESPGAGFVYSRFAAFDEQLRVCQGEYGSPLAPRETALRDGVVGAIRSFRRSVYQRTPGLDERFRVGQDRDLVYKLEEVTRPVFVDAILYRYRKVPGSHSHEPASREEGARNVLLARRAAVRRRAMRGPERLFSEAFFVAAYLAYSDRRPRAVRLMARLAASAMRRLAKLAARPLRLPDRATA